MEQIRLVFSEKSEFENQDKSIGSNFWSFD